MPYKNKQSLYAAQKRYRQRKRVELAEKAKGFRERVKTMVSELKNENIELKKTINLMRIEFTPDLPLISLEDGKVY